MSDIKLSECLFVDLQTDEQRRDWFSLGRGVATGIIAPALQPHLVIAYSKIVESSKLIEQQQARIAELEQREQELSATVERLRGAGNELRKPWDLSKILGAETRRLVEQWDSLMTATPQQNLNALKREVIDQFSEHLAYTFEYGTSAGDIYAESQKYANTKYPSDKESHNGN